MDKSVLSQELVFLILQFLKEEGLEETAHKLERDSGFYFDMKHFEDMVLAGKWDDAETYLSGFTRVDDNKFSIKIYFELRKQKFLETLDINDRAKALDILMKDLKVFSQGHEELFNEMTQLLTVNNIRDHASLSTYGDANSVRKMVMDDIKGVIKSNPVFKGKLKFPAITDRRLRHLLNQSLNWQHLLCEDPASVPVIQSLFVNHICKPSSNLSALKSEESNSLQRSDKHLSNCSSYPSTITDSPLFPAALTNPVFILILAYIDNRPCPSVKTAVDVLDPNEIFLKGIPCQASNEVTSAIANDPPVEVIQTLKEDSPPVTMDFHPTLHEVLLVGTHIGNIGLWDVNYGKKLFSRDFRVWNIGACSINFKKALEKNLCISVKKITWSPYGSLFGVAFSEHIVQLYSYHGGNCCQHLEIDAHDGSVNDLAFSSLNNQLLVITCGDDKTIKVWDAVNGVKCHTFEGHDAPVCSVCPRVKDRIHFFFSTSIDGKIKAWLYDCPEARVDYDAPGHGYTTLAYSTDDRRLFSCGSGKFGEPNLVEWDESEGYIKKMYKGLKKPCSSTIHFDLTHKGLLAAGDDHMVKFWDMDNIELWTSTDANGELLEYPCIRFNKEGTLLAVAAKENKIKILAIHYDILPKWNEIHPVHEPSILHDTLGKNGCKKGLEDVRTNSIEESHNKSKYWNVSEICKPSQCQFLQLPVHSKINKIVRLSYTNAGNGILALASNGDHLLWKWPQDNLNLDGKATTQVSPHIWQPRSVLQLMRNDLTFTNSGDLISSFALSKNDSYLMSTSGGIISLFNMLTYKAVTTIVPPAPMATTCLAFYPQDNNILAVGMDDSSILIYNVRTNKIEILLEGHSKRVTALAFSSSSNLLVSGDINAQIVVWNTNGWGKQKDRYLQIHGQQVPEGLSETHIQFHQDQKHFLAVRNTHLATYEATELRCVNQWVPEVPVVISQATFSSDGQTVYASFVDGTLAIFDAFNFQMQCRINPSAYLSSTSSLSIYPLAIAAHPQKPTQFAVGLTDGRIFVFEPQKPGGDWSSSALNDKEPMNTRFMMGVSGF
ncbi:topless-related protein 1-like [Gastrolobium bilobum]|uniref:topless-related protein 1-like n=1 Tax=Gastrolobium bilobum TaxID=150636 RepID=UPI002AAFB8F4|nr:topless-related protein 1-like [Gastrolobium bilobum]